MFFNKIFKKIKNLIYHNKKGMDIKLSKKKKDIGIIWYVIN